LFAVCSSAGPVKGGVSFVVAPSAIGRYLTVPGAAAEAGAWEGT